MTQPQTTGRGWLVFDVLVVAMAAAALVLLWRIHVNQQRASKATWVVDMAEADTPETAGE